MHICIDINVLLKSEFLIGTKMYLIELGLI
jgi:hypothetical protein